MNALTLLKQTILYKYSKDTHTFLKNFLLQYALSDLLCLQSEDHKISLSKQDKTNEYLSYIYGIDNNTSYNIIV